MINLSDVRKDTQGVHEKRGAKEGRKETDRSETHAFQGNNFILVSVCFPDTHELKLSKLCILLLLLGLFNNTEINSGVAGPSGDSRPSNHFPNSCSAVNNKPAFVPVYWSVCTGRRTTACTLLNSRNLQKKSTTNSQIFQSNKRL